MTTRPLDADQREPASRSAGMPWFINGRPEGSGPGGFARYHHEVGRRLVDSGRATVLRPPAGWTDPLRGHWWERRLLPAAADQGVLLSLANSGPRQHARQAVVIHDLLPLTHPHTVSAGFARVQRRRLPALCHSAATLITPSQQVAQQLAEHLGIGSGPGGPSVSVIPPGIDPVFRADRSAQQRRADRALLGLDHDRPVVAGLVSSIPRKNGAQVLRVLQRVAAARPEVIPLAVGHDGPVRVFGRAAVRPSHPAITDLGSVDDDALAALFRTASAFVTLSQAEGFGLPPLEALACGTPVVSTAVPSLLEHQGHGAVLVDGPDQAEAEVLRLLEQPPSGPTETDAGTATESRPGWAADLTWDRTASEIGRLLDRLESR